MIKVYIVAYLVVRLDNWPWETYYYIIKPQCNGCLYLYFLGSKLAKAYTIKCVCRSIKTLFIQLDLNYCINLWASELCPHHSKMQKDGWAKYIQFFSFQWCLHDRRTQGNKNENAKYVTFWEKALFDLDWPKSWIWKKLMHIFEKVY